MPTTPLILSFSPDTGAEGDGTTTSDCITLHGVADAGGTVKIFDGSTLLGTALVGDNGSWSFDADDLSDGHHNFKATAVGAAGALSEPSDTFDVDVDPSITSFSSNPFDTITVDGFKYQVQNGDENWNLSKLDSHTLRFEVASGDQCSFDANYKERSEISMNKLYAPGQAITVSYDMKIENGPDNTAQWMVIGQFHSNDPVSSPPFAVEMRGEKMAIMIRYSQPGQGTVNKYIYKDTADIDRGHDYSMKIEVNFENDSDGFLRVWRDGVLIADYEGPIGYNNDVYWKQGIYRYEASERFAVQYSNISVKAGVDEPAVALGDSNSTFNEVIEGALAGTAVGITAFAVDPDGSVTYSLVDDAGGRFVIDAFTGVVTVAEGAVFDYQAKTAHSIVVKAHTDSGDNGVATFKVHVAAIEGAAVVGTRGDDRIDDLAATPRLKPTGQDDVINARAGDDKIYGFGGDDVIRSGRGDDVIVGGSGADAFIFGKGFKRTFDDIRDFNVGEDAIEFGHGKFKKLEGVGELSENQFCLGTGAQDADDRIIYNPESGKLFYDANGSAEGRRWHFATLDLGLDLSHADFLIV